MANKWDERKKAQEDEYFVKKEREQLARQVLAEERVRHFSRKDAKSAKFGREGFS